MNKDKKLPQTKQHNKNLQINNQFLLIKNGVFGHRFLFRKIEFLAVAMLVFALRFSQLSAKADNDLLSNRPKHSRAKRGVGLDIVRAVVRTVVHAKVRRIVVDVEHPQR